MSEHLKRLQSATRAYERHKTQLDNAREQVVGAALDALRAGERPTDVTAASPFTAAYVRKLARENGIEGAAPGPKPPRS